MKEEIRELNPIVIEIAEELHEFERFVGISAAFDDNGITVFVGLVEQYNSELELIGKRYVKIKAKHLESDDNTFTKADLKVAFENGVDKEHSFDEWFNFKYNVKKV